MTLLKNWIFTLVKLIHAVKSENLHWQTIHQEPRAQLRQAQVLSEYALEAALKKKSVQLEHDIALLQTKNETELAMLKIKCQQEAKDYKQYLAALDQLKTSIQRSYTHLPEALAFTIHHHAKALLNKMWEADDFQQKMHYEMRLITFMTTVHEEARLHLEGEAGAKLPEKTLHLLQNPADNLSD
jgi:hypothetical protein